MQQQPAAQPQDVIAARERVNRRRESMADAGSRTAAVQREWNGAFQAAGGGFSPRLELLSSALRDANDLVDDYRRLLAEAEEQLPDVERPALLEQVRAFFEAYGQSRFAAIDTGAPQVFHGLAGFRRGELKNAASALQYLVISAVFRRELCSGFDHDQAVRWLQRAGWLRPGWHGRSTHLVRLPGLDARVRVYVFAAAEVYRDEGKPAAAGQ